MRLQPRVCRIGEDNWHAVRNGPSSSWALTARRPCTRVRCATFGEAAGELLIVSSFVRPVLYSSYSRSLSSSTFRQQPPRSPMVLDAALLCAPVGSSFVSRSFPPPALQNVPLPYILDQLHNLAVHYWDKPETADCTISELAVVFLHRRRSQSCSSCAHPTATTIPTLSFS